jgi:asparaginyl-tRNA synthetase
MTQFITIQQAIEQGEGQASLRGWVYRERESNKFKFIVLRDGTNVIQTVIKKDDVNEKIWNDAVKLQVEASIKVTGTLKKDDRAPTGVELTVTELEVVGTSHEFPITKDLSQEFLLDNRHLWLRSRKMNAIIKIRATLFRAFREYFDQNGFLEYHSPIFQATQAEGGSSLFTVKYFNAITYLAQTWQLYAEPAIFSYEKLYTIAPSFRAEKSQTSRHLTEYWHAEMEAAWASFIDIQDYGEGVIKHMVAAVLEKNSADLQTLGRDPAKLRPVVEKPFPRMTYTDALKILKAKFEMDIDWGKDLRTIEEDKLSSLYDTPIIVTEYPAIVKAFYMKETPGHPEVVNGCDFIAPEGYGEIIGGSEREVDIDILTKKLTDQGENPENYRYYLDTRRYGSVPHGGFGLGMERIVSWVCGLDNIKDAIPFPRTPARWTP